jgi:hypothetical protein
MDCVNKTAQTDREIENYFFLYRDSMPNLTETPNFP